MSCGWGGCWWGGMRGRSQAVGVARWCKGSATGWGVRPHAPHHQHPGCHAQPASFTVPDPHLARLFPGADGARRASPFLEEEGGGVGLGWLRCPGPRALRDMGRLRCGALTYEGAGLEDTPCGASSGGCVVRTTCSHKQRRAGNLHGLHLGGACWHVRCSLPSAMHGLCGFMACAAVRGGLTRHPLPAWLAGAIPRLPRAASRAAPRPVEVAHLWDEDALGAAQPLRRPDPPLPNVASSLLLCLCGCASCTLPCAPLG